MKIELTYIKVKDLVEGYKDDAEEGVCGYHGRLNIRPKYQREFIYKDKEKMAVIETISKGFPLNVMYWVKGENDENGNPQYELLDGQQRTMSICRYHAGEFAINWSGDLRGYTNLTTEQKEQFDNYEILVYICEGTDKEKLDWFNVINIAGEPLKKQEIRNAIYSGSWVTEAKRHFSKTGCPARGVSDGYMKQDWIRQEGLQTAIEWICLSKNIKRIEDYMAEHQHDTHCTELWLYFNEVINWAKTIFPKKRKELTSIDWGKMYLEFKDKTFDPAELEKEISKLMRDGEIQNKAGIYWYVLSRNEQYLNLRTFDDKTKAEVYEAQMGLCANPACPKGAGYHFDISEMEADHIVPWRLGGLTTKENCQMLCRTCNRKKSGK